MAPGGYSAAEAVTLIVVTDVSTSDYRCPDCGRYRLSWTGACPCTIHEWVIEKERPSEKPPRRPPVATVAIDPVRKHRGFCGHR